MRGAAGASATHLPPAWAIASATVVPGRREWAPGYVTWPNFQTVNHAWEQNVRSSSNCWRVRRTAPSTSLRERPFASTDWSSGCPIPPLYVTRNSPLNSGCRQTSIRIRSPGRRWAGASSEAGAKEDWAAAEGAPTTASPSAKASMPANGHPEASRRMSVTQASGIRSVCPCVDCSWLSFIS